MKFLSKTTLFSCLLLSAAHAELQNGSFETLRSSSLNLDVETPLSTNLLGTTSAPYALEMAGNQNYGAVSRAYFDDPDYNFGTVTFFNLSNGQITGQVNIGYPTDPNQYPTALAVSGTLTAVVGPIYSTDLILTIDQSTNTLLTSFSTGINGIRNIAFQNGTTLWAVNYNGGRAISINMSDPSNLSLGSGSLTFPAYASQPVGMALNGTTLAVTGASSNSVAILNNQTRQPLRSFSIPSNPWEVATNGTLWVTTSRSSNNFGYFNTGSTSNANYNLGTATHGVSMNATQFAITARDGAAVYFFNTSSPPQILGTVSLANSSNLVTRDVVLNGTTAYVALYDVAGINPGRLNIINTDNYSVIGTVSSNVPSAYGLGFNGSQLIATNVDNSYVSFFNALAGTLTFLGTAASGASPRTPAMTGTIAAVPCQGSNIINIYDIASRTSRGTISASGGPSFAVTNGNDWIVSAQGGNYASYFNPYTLQLTSNVKLSAAPYSINFSGTTGAIGSNDSNIYFFNPETGTVISTLDTGVLAQQISSSSNVGIASLTEANQAMLFDFTTKQALAFINTGTAPLSNAIDGNYAIVANNGANSVSVIDVSKKQVINTVEFPGAVGGVTLNGLTGYVVVNAGTATGYVQSFTITPSSNGFPVPAGNPNSDSTVQTIRAINGNCPVATQAMIDEFGTLTGQDYLDAARDLGPGLKLVQFSLEKLDLLLHKELESALYSSKEGTIPFVIAGYDNLDEGVNGPYNGYSIDSYYQMFGVTHDWKGAKWLATIGASESYMKVRPQPVKASYNTVWAALGGAGQSSRWHYGLDTIFGYSFIDGTRHIDFIDEKATTDHGAWNISFDGKLGYDFTNRVLDAMIYDDVSYIYGQENSYSETNSPAANLHVKNETISQIRNMLGLSFSSKQTKAFKIFADASWVYEHYFNNNTYQAAFVGTDVYGTYSQTEPSQNYARIHTGFKGEYKNFEWKLAYTGLFAKRFSENSASVKFGYKF